jgi:hypothetical protein
MPTAARSCPIRAGPGQLGARQCLSDCRAGAGFAVADPRRPACPGCRSSSSRAVHAAGHGAGAARARAGRGGAAEDPAPGGGRALPRVHRSSGLARRAAVLGFIFLYKLGDSLCTALATPFYLDMGYSKTDIGMIAKHAGLWPAVFGGLLGRPVDGPPGHQPRAVAVRRGADGDHSRLRLAGVARRAVARRCRSIGLRWRR